MYKVKLTAVIISVLVAGSSLSACGTTGNKTSSGQGKLAAKQVLNLTERAEIPSLDSSIANDEVSLNVLNNVMEGLYRLDKNQNATPGIAESYIKSNDSKIYTFKLRKDAKWSNGDPVTAKDFVYAWKRAVDPATKSEYSYILFDIKNAQNINNGKSAMDTLGVKAVDDYTLEVQLEHPVPYFIELTSFPTFNPLNEKYIKEKGAKFGLEADTTLYDGPFILSDWKHEQEWTYKKNNQYWDNKTVRLTDINVNIVKDAATGVNLYDTKQVDRAKLTSEFVDKYKGEKDQFITEPLASIYFLRLNEKRNGKDTPLRNKSLRIAIAMAFDKKGLADVILNDGSIPADFLVPKGFVKGADGRDFRDTYGNLLSTDTAKGKQYFETAKKELGTDKITLELLNYDTDAAKRTGEYIKDQLEKNLTGLTVNIKQQPFKQKLQLEMHQDYEFSLAGWGADYPDPMTFLDMFTTNSSYNEMSYSNPEYDKIINDAKSTYLQNPKERLNQLAKAEKILLDDAAIAPVYQRSDSYVSRPYIKGLVRHNFGGDYSYKWAYVEEH